MFGLFSTAPVISEQSSQWILDKFEDLFSRLGCQHFYHEAQLILPTAAFFPASATGADQMAQVTLNQLKQHSGMGHWPISIATATTEKSLPQLSFKTDFHGQDAMVISDYSDNNRIDINLDITQFGKAETLVATLSQQLAAILLHYSELKPEPQQYIAMTELLGTFIGFGVMLSNTSYQFKGGCGSCYNSRANRQTGLSEEEMVYSLAVFCQLKGVASSEVLPHLKRYLRPIYKKSLKQLINNQQFISLQQLYPKSLELQ